MPVTLAWCSGSNVGIIFSRLCLSGASTSVDTGCTIFGSGIRTSYSIIRERCCMSRERTHDLTSNTEVLKP